MVYELLGLGISLAWHHYLKSLLRVVWWTHEHRLCLPLCHGQSKCPAHTSTTAVIIFARLAGDLDTIATSSAYSMLHIVDVRGVSSQSLRAKGVERMLTRSASTWGSTRSFSSAVLRTAVKMLNCKKKNETPVALPKRPLCGKFLTNQI